MVHLKDIQLAFFDMMDVIDSGGPWIFTVYPDNDPRVHGDIWQRDGDTVYMSDALYALLCVHEGIANQNVRSEKQS